VAVIQPKIAIISPLIQELTKLISEKIKVRNIRCFFITVIVKINGMFYVNFGIHDSLFIASLLTKLSYLTN